jgi:ABC-type Mn2+/Zn2+ transport system ATPase subunit
VGVLSFDQFRLGLSERVTFVVGPNGAGKSNLTRLPTICLRAVESGDGALVMSTGCWRRSWRRITSAPNRRASRPASPSG